MAEYLKKVDLLSAAVEVEYLGRPRMMVSVAKIGQMPSIEAVPMEYHNKVCEEMARRHQAEIAELTADRPDDPHNITYINALKNRIRELEAKRPQGEWIWGNEKKSWHKCSVCGEQAYSYYDELADDVEELFDYCPNCGARMKGADDESVDVL